MKKHSRRDYRKYLKSPEWAAKRIQIIVRDNRQCQHCRVGGKYLQVHHKTYDRFGNENLHFEPGNSQDLAQKVRWAYAHPLEMAQMGSTARSEYEQKYTAEANYPMLMKIYMEAMNRQY